MAINKDSENVSTDGVLTTDKIETQMRLPLSGAYPSDEEEVAAREKAVEANQKALSEEGHSDDPAIAYRRRNLYGTLK